MYLSMMFALILGLMGIIFNNPCTSYAGMIFALCAIAQVIRDKR